MCGIIGYISDKSYSIESFKYYRDLMEHRGPNSSGIWNNENSSIILGHRRLSIIDLSENANQPMISSCKRFILVFNGEIYNYVEIKKILLKKGHQFISHSDSEVIINAYKEWGEDCLDYFNGMFSFALLDLGDENNESNLFFCRDRFGKKPFYYYYKNNTFIFASELKSIPKDFRGSLDPNAINNYLALGYVPGSETILKDIYKLPAGFAGKFLLESNKLKTWKWWDLPTLKLNDKLSHEEILYDVEKLIIKSVKIRLRSDVPVGILLSGGLDSSLITAIAANISSNKINTFTFGQSDTEFDESPYASIIAKTFDTNHTFLKTDSFDLNPIDEIDYFVDEPIADSSIIPTYLISKLAGTHVKVALGGDGGDEIFGGYESYSSALSLNRFMRFIPKSSLKKISNLASKFPIGFKGRNKIMSLKEGPFKSQIWGTPFFDIKSRTKLLSPNILSDINSIVSPENILNEYYELGDNQIENMIRMDIKSKLIDDFLFKVDRYSMASSLEIRSPFLDKDLSEYMLANVPTDLKVKYNSTRIIEKKIAKKFLPKNLNINRKQGFSIPLDSWLKNSKMDWKEKILTFDKYLFNREEITNLINGFDKGRQNGSRIFSLLMLNTSINNLN